MDNENKYKYLGIIERALDPAQSNVCFTTENAVIAAGNNTAQFTVGCAVIGNSNGRMPRFFFKI